MNIWILIETYKSPLLSKVTLILYLNDLFFRSHIVTILPFVIVQQHINKAAKITPNKIVFNHTRTNVTDNPVKYLSNLTNRIESFFFDNFIILQSNLNGLQYSFGRNLMTNFRIFILFSKYAILYNLTNHKLLRVELYFSSLD